MTSCRFRCSAWLLVLQLLVGAINARPQSGYADTGSGSVTFCTSPNFKGKAKRVIVDNNSNACINVHCLTDPPRSVFWAKLVADNTVDADGGSIAFFSNVDCKGSSVKFTTHALDSPATLEDTAVEKGIASFAVRVQGAPINSTVDALCTDADPVADAEAAENFSAPIAFFQEPSWGGDTATFNITRSQECYNVNVPGAFQFGSARWNSLPTWSNLNSKEESQLFMYEGANCRGMQHRFPYWSTPQDFRLDRLKTIGSVMLEQYSPFALTYKNVTLTVNSTLGPVAPFNGSVTLINKNTGWHRQFNVDAVGKCYNVACFGGKATTVNISGLPTVGRMRDGKTTLALYRDPNCNGMLESPLDPTMPSRDIDRKSGDVQTVQSFMIWANYDNSNRSSVDACAKPIDRSTPKSDTTSSVPAKAATSHSWIAIVGGCVAVVIGVAVFVLLFRKRQTLQHPKFVTAELGGRMSVIYTGASSMDTDVALRHIRIETEDVRTDAVTGQTDNAMVFRGVMHRHTVLVKKLLPELTQNEDAREAFLYDAKLASELNHPKILKFRGVYWTPHNEVGCVYEYAAFHDLSSFLRTHRDTLTWIATSESKAAGLPTKLSIATDVAEALVLLHSFQPPYPHGNLSVKSVALTASGTAKLWNFRPVDPGNMTSVRLTSTSERIRELEKVDIAAFGALLLDLDRCTSGPCWPEFSSSCPQAVVELARQCLSQDLPERPAATELFFRLKRMTNE